MSPPYVAIVGPGAGATDADRDHARRAGAWLAREGAIVLSGGLGGVMGATAEGVRDGGGVCIGLLPGSSRAEAHPAHTIAIPTGLGELRNGLLVRASDAVLAINTSWGTMSEIALAVRTEVPVVMLGGWTMPASGVHVTDSLDEALAKVLAYANERAAAV
ncbi:MAG: TIGR00725 family protein [Nocardioidaceae bacterium]